MKKVYNFWLLPLNKFYQSEHSPYSSQYGNPLNWAEHLFWCNPGANEIMYMAENGKKKYTIQRGNMPAFQG